MGRLSRILSMVTVAGTLSCPGSSVDAADATLLTAARQIFAPLPEVMATPENTVTPEKVALGRLLYFEPRVSLDGTASCARCHQPALYGTDALSKSVGVLHRVSPRNAPTVLNAALHVAAHWRGDRKSVEDQAKQALVGPPSFGNPSYDAAMTRLKAIPTYPSLFAKAFPGESDPVTPENWGKAIGAYERTLVTPAPFDAFLRGDQNALSAAQQAGLREFIEVGCAGCHSGVAVGAGLYQKFGVFENYWEATGSPNPDKGRFDVTHDPADMYVFKVASLRNVAMTPPYFHDGSVATLPEAVRIMGRVQLGKRLSDSEVNDIVAFLESLTGTLPAEFTAAPVLPGEAFQEKVAGDSSRATSTLSTSWCAGSWRAPRGGGGEHLCRLVLAAARRRQAWWTGARGTELRCNVAVGLRDAGQPLVDAVILRPRMGE